MKATTRDGLTVPVGIALRIMSDVCGGLYSAHNSTDETGRAWPIIHRDVSPHNVLVSRDGSAKSLGEFPKPNRMEFSAPTSSATEDWILVLDDAARNYPAPGIAIEQKRDRK